MDVVGMKPMLFDGKSTPHVNKLKGSKWKHQSRHGCMRYWSKLMLHSENLLKIGSENWLEYPQKQWRIHWSWIDKELVKLMINIKHNRY